MAAERGGTRVLVHEQIRYVARAVPDRVAVTDNSQTLTYGELDAQASELARRLRTFGVGPGTRVGLCHERAAVNVVGALATLRAGAAYVGLDPAHPHARLECILRDATVPVLLTNRSTIERLGRTFLHAIDLDERDPVSLDVARDADDAPVGFDDAAYVIYTSGSTGQPKGVQVSHGNLSSLVDWHRRAFRVEAADRASVLASPAFDASVWELWPYLTAGASLHIPDAETAAAPERLRDWLNETRITISFVPTPLAEAMLGLSWPEDVPLRLMLTGGDVLHRRPTPGTPFALVNNYGVAEATVVSTSGVVTPGAADGGVPGIGRAIEGTRLYVLDADGRPVRPGDAGELYVAGAGVAMGYLNRPDLTADRFLADPVDSAAGARMYRTGDLVRLTAGEELEFLGRLDAQVQVRGQRVELGEIAAVLSSHPSVARAVVIAREAAPGNLRLIAYVVPGNGDVPGSDVLRDHVSSRLPGYMVPSAVVAVDTLPLTSNGKVDRAALPVVEPIVRTADHGRTPIETTVAAIIAELLELDGIGRDDNFFEVGGHSLMAAQLSVRLEDRFDVELSLLTVFDNPTAAGIAAAIEHDFDTRRSRSMPGS